MNLLTKFANCVVGSIIVGAGVIAIMTLVGMMMETAANRNEDHDRCLKHATTGYEIEKCR